MKGSLGGRLRAVNTRFTSYMPYKKQIYWLKITLFSDVSDVSYSFDWLKITLFSDVIFTFMKPDCPDPDPDPKVQP